MSDIRKELIEALVSALDDRDDWVPVGKQADAILKRFPCHQLYEQHVSELSHGAMGYHCKRCGVDLPIKEPNNE